MSLHGYSRFYAEPIFIQVFTRKGINDLISSKFRFDTDAVLYGGEYDGYAKTERVARQFDKYYIQPPTDDADMKEWMETMVNYKKLFDSNHLLSHIIIGRRLTNHFAVAPILYELYVSSDGNIELFIKSTPNLENFFRQYKFKYSYQERPREGYEEFIFSYAKTARFIHIPDLKTIDDVFINKFMDNVRYYKKKVDIGIYQWQTIKDGFIYMINLPPKNLLDLLKRPQFYIEEYFTKYIEEFPDFLELTVNNREFYALNHKIANMYIQTVTEATKEDLNKFYYYLAKLILDAGIRLNDEQFKAVFEYLSEADEFMDARELRTKLFLQRLGLSEDISLGFDINIDYETILNFGLLVRRLIES